MTRRSSEPALFEVAKPAEVVPLGRRNAQTLVGEWINHCPGARPPKRVIGQVSKYIAEMLDEGVPYAWVRRGLASWQAKGMLPASLPGEVNAVMNSGARVERTQRAAEGWGRVAQRIVDGH